MDMEKINLKMSTKNIPIPSKSVYCQALINSIDRFINNARWKAYFFLNPDKKPSKSKETFGFKSLKCGPVVNELKELESGLWDIAANIKFKKVDSKFQNNLTEIANKLREDKKLWIAADKSNNFYRMDPKDYLALLNKEIHKDYKKNDTKFISNILSQ